jgi:two-component system, OmpR family, sensor kinase
MSNSSPDAGTPTRQTRLLWTLEHLLAIQATDVRSALDQASQLINDTLHADKSEVFLYKPNIDTLVASGISDTPMARKQLALGLNRQPVSNGGKTVEVFRTGQSFLSGHLDQEPDELPGVKGALGVRSVIVVALNVDGRRRGCIQIDSGQPDHFKADDVPFLEAAARWIGMVLHRTELIERIAQEVAARARQTAADELITILAHDLRAPLVALKGRAMLLQMRAQREGQQANLKDSQGVLQAAHRLERMIADLMDTARLEQGLFTLTLTVINLATVVRETATTLTTETSKIEVRAPDEIVVEADENRIRQVLENLLSNARRYSPAGAPISIDVTTDIRTDGAWAVVAVRDQGPGIDADLIPRLFTRFVAGRSTKGLGLGLFLARGIAEAHRGTLTLDTTSGQGTTFRLALPLLQTA